MEKCLICGREFKKLHGVNTHLKGFHKFTTDQVKDYYDNHIKADPNEGICPFNGKPTKFLGLTQGYDKYDKSDPEVRKKALATNSVEYLMKIKGMSESDAINYQNDFINKRVEDNKRITKERLKDDPDFVKKQSRYCKEFWMNKGYDEDKSIELAHNECSKNRDIFSQKLKDSPEEYLDRWESQIGYWLNKGFSKKEAEKKLKERQQTFTKEKLIDKYGEEEGLKRWQDRQDKWMNTMIEKYGGVGGTQNLGYSKISIDLFERVLDKHIIHNYFYKENEYSIYDDEFMKFYYYDFTDIDNRKIIEFHGDFWHCNPDMYSADFINPMNEKKTTDVWEQDARKEEIARSHGFDYLVIWESEYKNNPELTIKRAINFLKS